MSQRDTLHQNRRRFSLTMRISSALVCAAILPLLVMLVYTYFQTLPALTNQANQAMANDARTRVQLIDTYFDERVSDAKTLTQVPSVQSFLQLPPAPEATSYRTAMQHASYSLQAGLVRDKNYRNWSLFTSDGSLLLNAPEAVAPLKRGSDYVPSTYLQRVTAGEFFVSPVYGESGGESAMVEIYAPILALKTPDTPNPPVIGFMRATLKLDYIWNEIVQKNQGTNGTGSYAFIVDADGIRIADTDRTHRFTSVMELPTAVQEQIRQEQRVGPDQEVSLLADTHIAESIQSDKQEDAFQAKPAGQNEDFRVVRQMTASNYVQWHYFVLSPVATVTAVANQEFYTIALVVVLASLLVAVLGWFVGRGIGRPILNAVGNLRENSAALSTLATNQQDAASEQVWVVDSSQVGLQSIQYYTDAARVALRQLQDSALELAHDWRHTNPQRVDQALENIVKATKYLEQAMEYQHASNQKLATALRVATQVTEQLHKGATSATEAALQLEDVVKRLLDVAGRR